MSLPLRHRRILTGIEDGLSSDPALASLFVIFERLAEDEAMPWVETIQPRRLPQRLARVGAAARRASRRPAARIRALLLVPAALAAMVCAVTVAAVSHGGRGAPGSRYPARELIVTMRPCRLNLLRVPCQPLSAR